MKSSVSTTEIAVGPDRGYQLRGSALDQRLCLIHWLRRALRCSPQFVEGDFAPRLRHALAADAAPASALAEAIDACEPLLNRRFDARDRQFLQHYLLYCAGKIACGSIRVSTPFSATGCGKAGAAGRRPVASGLQPAV